MWTLHGRNDPAISGLLPSSLPNSKGIFLNKISQEDLKKVLFYDPDTGDFYRKSRLGKKAGSTDRHGYRAIFIGKKQYRAHRLAWIYMNGDIGDFDIDHINCNRSDNRISNLRRATRAQNLQNRKAKNPAGKYSSHVGVTWHKRKLKWVSQIMVSGVLHWLGYFDDEQSAADAYINAKRELHTFNPNISS